MQDELIAIKGVKDGLLISLSPTEKWQSVTDYLAARIDDRADFFAGANITVELGARPVPKYELSSLKALLERRGLSLSLVLSESDTTRASAFALDLKTDSNNRGASPEAQETLPVDPEETGTRGVLFRRTLRFRPHDTQRRPRYCFWRCQPRRQGHSRGRYCDLGQAARYCACRRQRR